MSNSYKQLSDFAAAEIVSATDLIYSENAVTEIEQKTTVGQLQYFVLSPISNSSSPDAGTLLDTDTVPVGRAGLFKATLAKIKAYVMAGLAPQRQSIPVLTAGQATYATSGYTPGLVNVFVAGVRLNPSAYQATDGESITITDASVLSKLVAGMTVDIDASLSINSSNTATVGSVQALDASNQPAVGTLTGAELVSVKQSGAFFQSTLTNMAQWVIQTFQGFTQAGTGAVSRTVQQKLSETVTVLDAGALTNGTGDQSGAINTAIGLLTHFPTAAAGGVIRLPPGQYALSAPIIVPFGFTLEGSGSDIYTSKIVLNPNFVGAAAIIVQDSNASYLNAHVRNLGIDCGNLSAVAGILFYGAYRNSSIENVVVQNVAGNAHGIWVAPQVGGTSRPLCESFTLRDAYVIKATGATSTQSGILLDTVQESTLINVKSFHGTNPGASGGWSCLHLRDCRGITVVGGGFVAGDNGILVEALNRGVVGITIVNPTFENLGACNLKIRGTGSNTVSGVKMLTAREETPKAPTFLDADNVAFMDVDIADGSALLGAGVNNSVVRGSGAGTITPTTGAQYTTVFYANQTRQTYQVSPVLEINSVSNPKLSFTAQGVYGSFSMYWSANATNDFGFRLTDPNGLILFNYSKVSTIVTWSQFVAFVKPTQLGPYAVASLPAVTGTGWLAYATNGRKVGEAAGSGTGVPVYYSNGAWRVFSTDAAVQA